MPRDPYRVLGVPYGASPAIVLAAYRRLSKEHHPDRNGGTPEATARFQELQRAYEELRGRPAPDGSIEDRLAALERELREAGGRGASRDARSDEAVRTVNALIDGLDGLSSPLD